MKKIIVLILMGLLLSACTSKNSPSYDRFTISAGQGYADLTKEDAKKVLQIIDQIEKQNFRDLADDEYYIGGKTMGFTLVEKESSTSYLFQLDTFQMIQEGKKVKASKIDMDYYQKTLYPELSRLFEKYSPLSFQLMNSPNGMQLTRISDGEAMDDLEVLDQFAAEMITKAPFSTAEDYKPSGEDMIEGLLYTDGVIKEEISLYENFMVIQGKKYAYDIPGFADLLLAEDVLVPGTYVLIDEENQPIRDENKDYCGILELREDKQGHIHYYDLDWDLYYDAEQRFIHFINPAGNYDSEPRYSFKNGVLRVPFGEGMDRFIQTEE